MLLNMTTLTMYYNVKQTAALFLLSLILIKCSSTLALTTAEAYTFTTTELPENRNYMPTLGNGHIGYTVMSDTIYMNGLYNGIGGHSHRARIPNYSNLEIMIMNIYTNQATYPKRPDWNVTYELDLKKGIFKTTIVNNYFKIIHKTYPHRFFTRCIINEIYIIRLDSIDNFSIKLNMNKGNDTVDIEFDEEDISTLNTINSNEIISLCGHTVKRENTDFQKNDTSVCVLWNRLPDNVITLNKMEYIKNFTFITSIDNDFNVALREIQHALTLADDDLEWSHIKEWEHFWIDFNINIEGNNELARAVEASTFYLISSLPSLKTFSPAAPYYGLSPSGLGRGGSVNDYQGHNFWDTEIWMFPVALLIQPQWAEELLNYRIRTKEAAQENARSQGYSGLKYPWESAFTGTEVITPQYKYLSAYQLHITADISFALRSYLASTQDNDFMLNEGGCELANGIGKFWLSKADYNVTTRYYDINNIMGPDEYNYPVNNNVYTNIAAGYAMHFAEFTKCICNQQSYLTNFSSVARHIKLPYDPVKDYHPQYEGYQLGRVIKQADVVLINYPLRYQMKNTTMVNDLKFYEQMISNDGPAMTWAIHTIGALDMGDLRNATKYLRKSYAPYIVPPFYVWNEMKNHNDGAKNFITGAGGVLQSLLYGYGGIRLYLDRLEIVNSRQPENTSEMSISGVKYLGNSLQISFKMDQVHLSFLELSNTPITLHIDDKMARIEKKTFYNITGKNATIKAVYDNYNGCKLPEDIIGIKMN